MQEPEQTHMTDHLLNVFNYSFVETMPYGFFLPKDARYMPVNLVDKRYHCPACGREFTVKYHHTGVTYFSKTRIASQRRVYGELGLDFPSEEDIAAEQPFHYEAVGYCSACAEKTIRQAEEPGQRIYNLCEQLHQADELLAAKGRHLMDQAVARWLQGITKAEQLLAYDLSSHEALRDLICAVILADTAPFAEILAEYASTSAALIAQIQALNADASQAWEAYTARSTALYESMADDLYHEYTVVFPEEGQTAQTFYIRHSVERSRVEMFLQQPRIKTMEELLLDVGFHEEWIDAVVDKGLSLQE